MCTASINYPSNILILGNHSCSNRGDAAILRGLVELLTEQYPKAKVTATTRYLNAARYIIDHVDFVEDTLFKSQFNGNRLVKAIKVRVFNKINLNKLANKKYHFLATKQHREFSQQVTQYDLIIQVGGSFFVDLYGEKQYEAPLIAKSHGVPYIMAGHSIGPFQTEFSKKLARTCFNNTPLLLREHISAQHLIDLDCGCPQVIQSADTAWLVPTKICKLPEELIKYTKKPTIAFTLRDLKPFDERLGISQETFENSIIELCNYLENLGYQILFASTCTGLDSYHKDDRMIALRVQQKLNKPSNAIVVMDELNDTELGSLFRLCQLTIGTRLHSAIISKNFGTPAFAISYEHKSTGILGQMGLESFSIDIHHIDSKPTKAKVVAVLDDLEYTRQLVSIKVNHEKELARQSIIKAIEQLNSNEK